MKRRPLKNVRVVSTVEAELMKSLDGYVAPCQTEGARGIIGEALEQVYLAGLRRGLKQPRPGRVQLENPSL